MNDFLEQIRLTVGKNQLLEKGDRVLVALSGGADSVALLKALTLVKEEYNLTLTAAHVHHGIRGEEANADCRLAQTLCEELKIPFLVHRANIPALCKQTGEGEEECGRRVRYEFFRSVPNVDKIATAHTLNDSAETLILHLSRGAGLQGLRGILPKRGNIIRPLIDCTREQVEAFCKEFSLPFAIDSTNANTQYRRNYIRHEVLPRVTQINPSFLERVRDCTAANQKDFDYLTAVGQQLLKRAKTPNGYSLAILTGAHPVELHYALQEFFAQNEIFGVSAAQWQSVEALLKKGEGKCSLPENRFACVFQGTFYLEEPQTARLLPPLLIENFHTVYSYESKQILFSKNGEKEDSAKEKVCNLVTYTGPDCDKIGKSLQLRTRLAGDSLRLPHRGCTKTLKKLMNELKIPHHQRNRLLVLCDETGVLWVEGIGCDERCAPTNQTKHHLMITIGVKE